MINNSGNNLEEDILYLNESIQQIYTKMSEIYEYIALSDVIVGCMSKP